MATLGAALVLTGVPTLGWVGPSLKTLEITAGVSAADAASRRSGGYSRPSSGGSSFSSRTPSFGSRSVSRTPSTSSGYARPSAPSGGFNFGSQSAGDRDMSRRSGGEALQRYRAEQAPPPPATTAPSAPRYDSAPRTDYGDYGFGGQRRRGGYDSSYSSRGTSGWGWAGSRGWSPSPYVYRSAPRFGIWDGLFLWFLLDNLTSPGYADFFHNHQNDPGYQQWRQEADRMAGDNADLREKLAALDAKLAQQQDQPRDPNYLPPDTPREVALADEESQSESGGFGEFGIIAILLVGGGIVFLIWLRRKQRGSRPARSGGSGTMGNLRTAGNIIRHKLSGETYSPSLFRVGMTVTLDPTPFILAAGTTKVATPSDVSGTDMLVSIETVSTIGDGAATLHRLYLPQERGFFQIHLNTAGQPDECRFFSLVDEVHPASNEEWGFWLDPAEGMIGWPEFQTKDGKTYPRLWAPGPSRIQPHTLYENGTDKNGITTRTIHTMLYAAPTGAADPAPPTEYIMVSAIERGSEAWVEIHAGIDVNPAALSLS